MKGNPRPLKGIILALFICCAAGCSTLIAMRFWNGRRSFFLDEPQRAAEKQYNRQLVDSAVAMLHSGDIVVRSGLGADSYMFAHLNTKNKTYSHCGIVMIEHGYPFVYHSIGGEDNPNERLRRDSARFFFSPAHNSGFGIVHYDLANADISRLKQVVYTYYKARPKFDMQFDLGTDDKLYCAEFVYKALNKAMNDASYIKTTSVLGHTFVSVDNLFVNPHAHMIWQVKFK